MPSLYRDWWLPDYSQVLSHYPPRLCYMICRSVEYVEHRKAPPIGFLDATPSLAEIPYAVRLSPYYHVRLASHPSKHSPYVSTITS
jgi:hypothetical protein